LDQTVRDDTNREAESTQGVADERIEGVSLHVLVVLVFVVVKVKEFDLHLDDFADSLGLLIEPSESRLDVRQGRREQVHGRQQRQLSVEVQAREL